MNDITVDVVSDVVCPWCFIGKRHLDRAIALWHAARPGGTVMVRWHPFFLNPDTPEAGEPYRPFLERKFGGPHKLAEIWHTIGAAGTAAGIDFAFEKIELRANTLNAHRLIHYAQNAAPDAATLNRLIEGLFATQFIEGRHVGDRAVLAAVAGECGMDRAAVKHYLDSTEDAEEVRAAAAEMQGRGINSVPFFIFNQRLAASGAQLPGPLFNAMCEAAS